MSSLFRKPKRNVRVRQASSSSEDEENRNGNEDDSGGLRQIQSSIAAFKEKKSKKKSSKAAPPEPKLSFNDDLEPDEGEVFQVKKSSASRRLMKQKKQENRKSRRKQDDDDEDDEPPPSLPMAPVQANMLDPELDIKIRDTIPKKPSPDSWILTGKEAEALHMEEEDDENGKDDEEDEDEKDPIRSILETGAIPDAAAIHAARKKRQAARERGDYIPVKKPEEEEKGKDRRLLREEDQDSDDDERISFTGVKSNARDREQRKEGFTVAVSDEDDDDHGWEKQQIRKAINSSHVANAQSEAYFAGQFTANSGFSLTPAAPVTISESMPSKVPDPVNMKRPAAYNLQGIKDRIKDRLESMNEVHRRHQSDADRAVDDLVNSQTEIDKLTRCIPDLTERHKFYQELRGYFTDLIECFDEKIVNIKYLEDKLNKSKADLCVKVMERRRQDVRDQMIELSSKPLGTSVEENAEESNRQRRAAEREGRRRRRREQRRTAKHYDGLSSDDELSSLDQAGLAKVRGDVENQARSILSDVVEEFSTIEGVRGRLEAWKQEDPDSYTDAYISLCLPKLFSPLVRLQVLLWNPFAENSDIDKMEWYKSLAVFSFRSTETEPDLAKDPDRRLLSLMIEKVIIPKLTGLVRAAYDPMSSTQTLRLTGMLNRLRQDYPSLSGESKQLRELLSSVRDRLKGAVDSDVYIPVGYQKQLLENSKSGHSMFFNRQFWGCFKLLNNLINWQGLIGDAVLADITLNSVLNRYLLFGLGVNPDPNDTVDKCRLIVDRIPSEWTSRFEKELKRFVGFLAQVGQSKMTSPASVQCIVSLMGNLGATEECAALKKARPMR